MHKTLVDAEIKVNISGRWTPTPQRENDRVIMDLAKKHTPEWTWDRINRCRLFLQATTTTDITSIEGRFIPMRVREVRNPLRQNNLQFPLQKRPAKGDIRHWRYLVECISQNGHLNTPLGHWTRHPDQKFCHLYLPSTDVMYKRTKDRWEIFGKTKQGTRRYLQRNFYVGEPPKDSIPVKVIDGVRYIILPQKDEIIRYNRHKQGQFTQNIVQKEIDKAVLGTYQIYPEQKEKLQEIWNIGGTLICATDGGLKDTMGTSSYVFYLPNDLQPIVEGFAGEHQPMVTASSTRQELLGQLGMDTLRVLDTDKKIVLWDSSTSLKEIEQFEDNFKIRDRTFRKGNRKVTLFCVIESTTTINKIKYTASLKEYIRRKNVWIKPDWYSTKVVTSPGFLTLVHPRQTNKQELVNDLVKELKGIRIQEEDAVVQEWNSNNPIIMEGETGVRIPSFHVETTTKKWGEISCEVLSLHCKSEDTKYIKYLFSEANAQGIEIRGLFIPTGLPQMEGGRVLSNLLAEHLEYVHRLTSIQITGISYSEMKENIDRGESIHSLTSQCDGVKAVEPTYKTQYTGQWMLIVDKTKLEEVKKHITDNLQKIYQQRRWMTNMVAKYTQLPTTNGLKLILIEKWENSVGSYAEALTKRFTSGKTRDGENQGHESQTKPRETKEKKDQLTSDATTSSREKGTSENNKTKQNQNMGSQKT